MSNKKIGIVADNYKLNKFKEELDKRGIVYKTAPLTADSTAITFVSTKEIGAQICYTVETFF